jgi:hypothetical protein
MESWKVSKPSMSKALGAFRPLAFLLMFLGAVSFGHRAAGAQERSIQGVFVNQSKSDEAIRIAIDAAVKDFNFIARPIARSRLKKTNPLITRIEIAHTGNAVSIQLDKSKPTVTEPGKPPIKWTRDDGEEFDVSTDWKAGTLQQSFVAPDGTRTNRFSISPDGSILTVDVTLTSPQLKAPVNYRLVFARER